MSNTINSSFRKKPSLSSSGAPGLSEWGLRGHTTPVNKYDGFDDWDDEF